MRNPGGDVHSISHAQEGRRFLRARRAQEKPCRSIVREGPQQPRVLRVRRHRATNATYLLVGGRALIDRATGSGPAIPFLNFDSYTPYQAKCAGIQTNIIY